MKDPSRTAIDLEGQDPLEIRAAIREQLRTVSDGAVVSISLTGTLERGTLTLLVVPSPRPSVVTVSTHVAPSLSTASSLAELSPFQASGPPPPGEALTNLAPIHQPLRRNRMPSVERRFRESVTHHVDHLRNELDRLGELTAVHRRRDLLRWPKMVRRANLAARIAGARDITAEQVLRVKRSGLWRTNSLKPIFSGVRTYCALEGNPELAALASVWRLPRRSDDRRVWADERQLLACYATARGRVKVRVALQGYLGMREDSARDLRVRDLMLDGPVPRMNFATKGRDGERLTITVDPEIAGLLRSWVESKGLGAEDRIYPVQHSCADADLRALGREVGLPFPLTGHVLRRSWARIAYLANPCLEQVRRIQRILGHRSIETTWHYIGIEYLDMDAGLSLFHRRMREAARPPEG